MLTHYCRAVRSIVALASLAVSAFGLRCAPFRAAEPARAPAPTARVPAAAIPARTTFDIDPIVDGTVIAISLGFASILDLVNSTGEIRPQRISPTFERSDLLLAAMTAAVGGTATYLAFARSPSTARPWITLVLAAGLSTFVSVERVRAGVHFPTDVTGGSIAGAVGVLVPRLHQSGGIEERRVWVGFRRDERGRGGALEVGGLFQDSATGSALTRTGTAATVA
jgi:hypothetical protein